ncbi:MAG: type II CRISPR-associated endonuclease Cas1 [Runella sp.]
MIKRTLYFGNPYYLSKRLEQLVIKDPNTASELRHIEHTVPIEDLGLVMLDHPQITVSQALLESLLQHNVAVVSCDSRHHPAGMLLPLEGHHTQAVHIRHQIAASEPLKKQLWQQIVVAKIKNQAALLERMGKPFAPLLTYAKNVKSGDPDNYEARAAVHYWAHLFPSELDFRRDRDGLPPNHLLNYGYAILRALVARAVVGAGLLPVLGIHHHNKYNAFALADDLMEPYRPFVDAIVCQIVYGKKPYDTLSKDLKAQLMNIATIDVKYRGERSPLLNSTHFLAAAVARCFGGDARKIALPEFPTKKSNDLELQLPLT